MANTDGFVDEVADELRRDRMSRVLRRWGWVAIVAVVLLVGAASFAEWRRASEEARTEAFGTAALAAIEGGPEALASVPAETEGQEAVLALLRAATADEGGLARRAALTDLTERSDLPPRLVDLAAIQLMTAGGTGDDARDGALLDRLAMPGAPYRALAIEMQALRAAEAGDRSTALVLLRQLTEEAGVSPAARRRAGQLIVALGGSAEDA